MFRITIKLLFLSVLLSGCGGETKSSQPKEMLEENLNCPGGSVSEIARWGGMDKNGWSHSCKMRHGKYHVWNNGVLSIQGQYKFGKKDGEWLFSDDSGKVTKKIIYKGGKKYSSTAVN